MINLTFDVPIDRLEKILTMKARMEPQDIGGQHMRQDLTLPRTHAEGFGIGPGNVPEQGDGRFGNLVADEFGQQREVKVLNHDHRTIGIRLRRHHVRKLGVDLFVGLPVRGAKGGSYVG
jgi:hypothetical protein